MDKQVIKVDENNSNVRLDIFLTKNLTNVPSRTFIKKAIDAGKVTVNQQQVKVHYKVIEGDEVVIQNHTPEVVEKDILPEDMPLDVFYEDENLLIINKPIGLLTHPVPGCSTGTLVNALLHYCSLSSQKTLSDINTKVRPGIVHRLDKETSGLLVVAKDNVSHVRLARQFEKRRVKKKYVAFVKGTVAFDEGIIDAPLRKHPRHWDKKYVSFAEKSKEAKTFYRVLKRYDNKISKVALYPHTGRTHQLRVHMAYLGHSILGDSKYGDGKSFPRLALHAHSLGFTHPSTKKFVEFVSSLPEEFNI